MRKMPRSKSPKLIAAKPQQTLIEAKPTPVPGGFLKTMKDGFAFGIGSSLARNLIETPKEFLKESEQNHQNYKEYPLKCKKLESEFNSCIQSNSPEETCQKEMDDLNMCFIRNEKF